MRTHSHNHLVFHALGYQIVGAHEAKASHLYWQILYVGQGVLTVHCDGSSYELASRQTCLIQPLEEYHLSPSADESCGILNIGIAFGLNSGWSMKARSPWQRVDLESSQGLASGFDRVATALVAADRTGVAESRRFIFGMLPHFVDGLTQVNSSRTGTNQTGNLVDTMRQLLAQNANRSYRIKRLQRLLNLSDRHLSRVFKGVTGVTIKAYHDRMRMNIAINLITTTNLNLTEISNELGFDSIQSFSRRFKTMFKCSPLRFRQEVALNETAPNL